MCATKPKNPKQLLENGTVYGSRAIEKKQAIAKKNYVKTTLLRILLGPKFVAFFSICIFSSFNDSHFRRSFLYSRHSTFDDIEHAEAYFGRLFGHIQFLQKTFACLSAINHSVQFIHSKVTGRKMLSNTQKRDLQSDISFVLLSQDLFSTFSLGIVILCG